MQKKVLPFSFRICIRSQSYDSYQMVPSSPSCASDSGLTSDPDTIGSVSSPYQTFKIEEDNIKTYTVTSGITTSKSWDAYESLDALDDLFTEQVNNENNSCTANQVKIEPGDLGPIMENNPIIDNTNQDWLDEILYGSNSGVSTPPSCTPLSEPLGVHQQFSERQPPSLIDRQTPPSLIDTHDDSSTDLFPDLGCFESLIASH